MIGLKRHRAPPEIVVQVLAYVIPGVAHRMQIGWYYTAPGKPMPNDFIESFSGRLCNELPNETLFPSRSHARANLQARRNDTTSTAHIFGSGG